MKAERTGQDDDDDSRCVSPERVPSSKHGLEGSVSPERAHSAKRSHGDDDKLEEETAKRIRLAFPKANKQFVEAFNSISTDEKGKVEAAIKKLCVILEEEKMEDGTTVAFMRLGGHIALMNAMKKHRNCIDIQRWACYIISRICYTKRNIAALDGVGGFEGVAASFGAVGAFDRIKECLEHFRENENLVKFAVTSCNKLLVHSITHNLDLFLESVGIERVVESMKKFSTNEDIQVFCCHILWLCIESRARTIGSLKNVGAMSVIGAVMDHYPDQSVAVRQAKLLMTAIVAK